MKKSRFTEEQIIGFIRQAEAEAGMPVKELCRKGGFSDATSYKWRAKYGGMDVSDAKRLRELESENAKLKKLLAEAPERRACCLVGLARDSYRHPPQETEMNQPLSAKIIEIAHVRRRAGYRRIHDLLRPVSQA